jgi:hypothetical protein
MRALKSHEAIVGPKPRFIPSHVRLYLTCLYVAKTLRMFVALWQLVRGFEPAGKERGRWVRTCCLEKKGKKGKKHVYVHKPFIYPSPRVLDLSISDLSSTFLIRSTEISAWHHMYVCANDRTFITTMRFEFKVLLQPFKRL